MNDPYPGHNPAPSNGMAIAALVIGIGSMVLAIIPIVGFLSWLLSPLAIILGAIALRKGFGRGIAWGGIITGVIGVLICIAWVALFGAALSAAPEGTLSDIQAEIERAAQEANQANQAGQASSGGQSAGDYQATPGNAPANQGATPSGDYQAAPTNSGDYQAAPPAEGVGTTAGAGTSGGK